MKRTQIYLSDDLYFELKNRSKKAKEAKKGFLSGLDKVKKSWYYFAIHPWR